jgi:hypothetical protein
MSLTKTTYSMIEGASVNVFDFGAVGNGVADDTTAIQAAIDHVMAQGYGGEIWFPQGQYRVTQTIEMIGDYTAPNQPRSIRLVGAQGTQNTFPSSANPEDVANNTYIFGDGIAVDNPVFYCWGGNNNTFEHLSIFGAKNSEAVTQAYACVWVDFNHENYRFYDCRFGLAPIGIRVCSSYDYDTDTWTPGVSAYDGTTFVPSTLVGGFASDNHMYENCTFRNSLACLSIESAQALDMVAMKCVFIPTGTGKAAFFTGCQGFSFYDTTILGETFIHVFAKATVGNIATQNHHIENGVDPSYAFYHASATPIGKGCSITTGGGGLVVLNGTAATPESTFNIKNSILAGLQFDAAEMSAIVENSTINNLNKTVGGAGKLLSLSNVYIGAFTGTNWNTFDSIILESTTLPGFTDLASVPLMSGSGQYFAPDFVVGTPLSAPAAASQISGASFTYFNEDSLIIGVGGHLSPAGTFIADSVSGAQVNFISSGVTAYGWTGATIGSAPTLVPYLSNLAGTGMYVPQRTSDGSVPVGSMYYNTATGKFRRRDGTGWADF